MIFKPLSREEYERLTSEQRLDYLTRLIEDIRQKVEENRQKLQQTKNHTEGP